MKKIWPIYRKNTIRKRIILSKFCKLVYHQIKCIMVNFPLNRYLKTNHEDCSKKLQRATEIISSLGGEKDRWAMAAQQMDECLKSLTGNVLINYNGMSSISKYYTFQVTF